MDFRSGSTLAWAFVGFFVVHLACWERLLLGQGRMQLPLHVCLLGGAEAASQPMFGLEYLGEFLWRLWVRRN
jgi:hypothetical protein